MYNIKYIILFIFIIILFIFIIVIIVFFNPKQINILDNLDDNYFDNFNKTNKLILRYLYKNKDDLLETLNLCNNNLKIKNNEYELSKEILLLLDEDINTLNNNISNIQNEINIFKKTLS